MAEASIETHYLHDRIDRLRAGDAAAANDIITACAGQLERLARKMIRGFPKVRVTADTGDVFQQASLRLLKALESIRPESTRDFFGLACTQMRRELIDLARAAARRPTVGLDAAAEVAEDEEDLSRWGSLHEAVEGLPAEQREVFCLEYFHGWKQKQMAELLCVDERTIRRYRTDAMISLQRKLGEGLPRGG